LYRWFWQSKKAIKSTANEINKVLKLDGKYEIKPDLPCLAVGSVIRLLVLSVNPGWKEDLNSKEDKYCQKTEEQYIDLMLNIFEKGPDVWKQRIRWWGKPFWFVRLLNDGVKRFGNANSSEAKWRSAHKSKLIGGWELFPFHSESDGISSHIRDCNPDVYRLRESVEESVRAAIRMSPEVLLIASPVGTQIVHRLFPDKWFCEELGTNTRISYCSLRNDGKTTEIFTINHQIFSARRSFTNDKILKAVKVLRSKWHRQHGR
jgi:hypothetical protein